jgi:hypothetical protein
MNWNYLMFALLCQWVLTANLERIFKRMMCSVAVRQSPWLEKQLLPLMYLSYVTWIGYAALINPTVFHPDIVVDDDNGREAEEYRQQIQPYLLRFLRTRRFQLVALLVHCAFYAAWALMYQMMGCVQELPESVSSFCMLLLLQSVLLMHWIGDQSRVAALFYLFSLLSIATVPSFTVLGNKAVEFRNTL